MKILAFDLAEYRIGFVYGKAGTIAPAQLFKLKKSGERTEEACARFALWLDEFLTDHDVQLVCAEHYMTGPQSDANGKMLSGAKSHDGQVALHYTVRAVAALHRIPIRAPYPASIRSHFCGKMSAAPRRPKGYKRTDKERAADRNATKEMVLRRARELGYIGPDCVDDNMADAAALFDFSSMQYGGAGNLFR